MSRMKGPLNSEKIHKRSQHDRRNVNYIFDIRVGEGWNKLSDEIVYRNSNNCMMKKFKRRGPTNINSFPLGNYN